VRGHPYDRETAEEVFDRSRHIVEYESKSLSETWKEVLDKTYFTLFYGFGHERM